MKPKTPAPASPAPTVKTFVCSSCAASKDTVLRTNGSFQPPRNWIKFRGEDYYCDRCRPKLFRPRAFTFTVGNVRVFDAEQASPGETNKERSRRYFHFVDCVRAGWEYFRWGTNALLQALFRADAPLDPEHRVPAFDTKAVNAYAVVRAFAPDMETTAAASLSRQIQGKYLKMRRQYYLGNGKLPFFERPQPIVIPKTKFELSRDHGKFLASFSLGRSKAAVELRIDHKEWGGRTRFLDAAISGECSIRECAILRGRAIGARHADESRGAMVSSRCPATRNRQHHQIRLKLVLLCPAKMIADDTQKRYGLKYHRRETSTMFIVTHPECLFLIYRPGTNVQWIYGDEIRNRLVGFNRRWRRMRMDTKWSAARPEGYFDRMVKNHQNWYRQLNSDLCHVLWKYGIRCGASQVLIWFDSKDFFSAFHADDEVRFNFSAIEAGLIERFDRFEDGPDVRLLNRAPVDAETDAGQEDLRFKEIVRNLRMQSLRQIRESLWEKEETDRAREAAEMETTQENLNAMFQAKPNAKSKSKKRKVA